MFLPGSSKKLFWKCNVCGYEWSANINSRHNGSGCPRCAKKERYTTATWIDAAINVHGNTYDYSNVQYINSKTPVTIGCKKHGDFIQLPSEHLAG